MPLPSEKSYVTNFMEAEASEAQEYAELAYAKYVRGRDSNPPALNLGQLQKTASYWYKDAREKLWQLL